jgi:hypothetical protein
VQSVASVGDIAFPQTGSVTTSTAQTFGERVQAELE